MQGNDEVLSHEQVLSQFARIQEQHRQSQSELSTKAEVALRTEQEEAVEQALSYTVGGIVRGLASLQLDFGSELDKISETLSAEAGKLEELHTAISIEQDRLKDLDAIRVSAEALALLTQSHERQRAAAKAEMSEARAEMEAERTSTREAWATEQSEHEAAVAEHAERLTKERQASEEAAAYALVQQRMREADAYRKRKLDLERSLAATDAEKRADAHKREAFLASVADELAELTARDLAFPEELSAAKDKERTAGIKKANEEARVAAALAEREFESAIAIFEAQSATLQEKIEAQATQLAGLLEQLAVASTQSQELAVKAIDTSARPTKTAAPSGTGEMSN